MFATIKAKSAIFEAESQNCFYFLLLTTARRAPLAEPKPPGVQGKESELVPFFLMAFGSNHYEELCIGSSYVFSNLAQTILFPETHKIPINILGSFCISTEEEDKVEEHHGLQWSEPLSPCLDAALISRMKMDNDYDYVINYGGVVTAVFDDIFGLYEIDETYLLCLAYYPRFRNGERALLYVGEQISLFNVHYLGKYEKPSFMEQNEDIGNRPRKRHLDDDDHDGDGDDDEFAILVPCCYSLVEGPGEFSVAVDHSDQGRRSAFFQLKDNDLIAGLPLQSLLALFSAYLGLRETFNWIEGLNESGRISLIRKIFMSNQNHPSPAIHRDIYQEFFHHHHHQPFNHHSDPIYNSCIVFHHESMSHHEAAAQSSLPPHYPLFDTVLNVRRAFLEQFMRCFKIKSGFFDCNAAKSLVLKAKVVSRFLAADEVEGFPCLFERFRETGRAKCLFGILKVSETGMFFLEDYRARILVVFKDSNSVARIRHGLSNVLVILRNYDVCAELVPKSFGEIYPYLLVDLSGGDKNISFLAQMKKPSSLSSVGALAASKFTSDIVNNRLYRNFTPASTNEFEMLKHGTTNLDISWVFIKSVLFSDYTDAGGNYLYSVVVEGVCLETGASLDFSVLSLCEYGQWLKEGVLVHLKQLRIIALVKPKGRVDEPGSATNYEYVDLDRLREATQIFAEFDGRSQALKITTQIPDYLDAFVEEHLCAFLQGFVGIARIICTPLKTLAKKDKGDLDFSMSLQKDIARANIKNTEYFCIPRVFGRVKSKGIRYLDQHDSSMANSEDVSDGDAQLWMQLILEDVYNPDYVITVYVKLQSSFPLGILAKNKPGTIVILRQLLVRRRKGNNRDCYFSLACNNIDLIPCLHGSEGYPEPFEYHYFCEKFWKEIINSEILASIKSLHREQGVAETVEDGSNMFIDALLYQEGVGDDWNKIFRVRGQVQRVFQIEFHMEKGESLAMVVGISRMEVCMSDGTGDMRVNFRPECASQSFRLLTDNLDPSTIEAVNRYASRVLKSIGSLSFEPDYRCSMDPSPPPAFLSDILKKPPTSGNFFILVNYLVSRLIFTARPFDFVGRVRTSGSSNRVQPNPRILKMTADSASKAYETVVSSRRAYMDLIRLEPTNHDLFIKNALKELC